MTYWDETGRYQEQANQLKVKLRVTGYCEDIALELFRATSIAYYDIYNNGGCNPNCFELLQATLKEAKVANFKPFKSKEDEEIFNEFLVDATSDGTERDFYLFDDFDNLKEKDAKILQLMEKFVDAVIEFNLGEVHEKSRNSKQNRNQRQSATTN